MDRTVLDSIGNAPLFKLQRLSPTNGTEVWVKWERSNPGGSIKDRAALHIVRTAEEEGLLEPGGTIIESSSGNFGISLAMIGAACGYQVIILIDPKTTPANRKVLKAFGAKTVVVTDKDDTGSYHKTRISLANQLAREIPNSFRPDQCFSLLNSRAHYMSTAEEIISQTCGKIDALVTTVSTGGHLGGISRYLDRFASHVRLVGADAQGSGIFGGDPEGYLTPGVGLGWTPENLDLSLIDAAYKVKDEDIFMATRALARFEGILAGASSGAAVFVALSEAFAAPPGARILAVLADGGDRYLDTVYDEQWLHEQELSTETPSLEVIHESARSLTPMPGGRPSGNILEGIADELDVPSSTLDMNAHIRKEITSVPPPLKKKDSELEVEYASSYYGLLFE